MTGRPEKDGGAKGWRAIFAAHKWDALDGLWPHLPTDAQRELFDELRRSVPKITVEDGVEKRERHVRSHEAPEDWKGAAEILERGALETAIKGERPKTANWTARRQEAELVMYAHLGVDVHFRDEPEPELPKELSAKWHAGRIFGNLALFDMVVADALHHTTGGKERQLLMETIALSAALAFDVGQHMRAATGKLFEGHAVRGRATKEAASAGGKRRAATLKARTAPTIVKIREMIAEGYEPPEAARLAFTKYRLGASVAANARLITRYGLRKKVRT